MSDPTTPEPTADATDGRTTSEEPSGLATRDATSGRHSVHVPHLVTGLALLGLVVVWALVVPLGAVDLHDAHWLLPLPWLVAGAAGLVATVLARRRRP